MESVFALRATPDTLHLRLCAAAPRVAEGENVLLINDKGALSSPSSPFGLCRARFTFGYARLRHA
jgi:hypothetical protein